MKFEIKARFSGNVLFTAELDAKYESEPVSVQLGAAVKAALKARANLAGANLARANLARANLADADLARADLAGANLARANLARANLAGANLAGADLADADLAGANLARANFDIKPASAEQAVENLDKVREVIMENAARLNMEHWHGSEEWKDRTCAEEAVCGTTHCLAGWLQVCATDERIRRLDSSQLAGTLQAPIAASMFFESSRRCLEWLTKREYAKAA
jgi:hypothetical protein